MRSPPKFENPPPSHLMNNNPFGNKVEKEPEPFNEQKLESLIHEEEIEIIISVLVSNLITEFMIKYIILIPFIFFISFFHCINFMRRDQLY